MHEAKVYSKTFHSHNVLRVSAGSNFLGNGDAGDGDRTLLRFEDEGGTDFSASMNECGLEEKACNNLERMALVFKGECERETLIEALEFALGILKQDQATIDSSESYDIELLG